MRKGNSYIDKYMDDMEKLGTRRDVMELVLDFSTKLGFITGLRPDDAFLIVLDSIDALFVQLCTDCGCIMERHDNLGWRMHQHEIRCEECAEESLKSGHSLNEFESLYVE